MFDGGSYAAQALRLIIDGELAEGSTYNFPTEPGLNGGVLCDGSADAQALVDGAFGLLAAYDGELMDALGGISAEAYAGG